MNVKRIKSQFLSVIFMTFSLHKYPIRNPVTNIGIRLVKPYKSSLITFLAISENSNQSSMNPAKNKYLFSAFLKK